MSVYILHIDGGVPGQGRQAGVRCMHPCINKPKYLFTAEEPHTRASQSEVNQYIKHPPQAPAPAQHREISGWVTCDIKMFSRLGLLDLDPPLHRLLSSFMPPKALDQQVLFLCSCFAGFVVFPLPVLSLPPPPPFSPLETPIPWRKSGGSGGWAPERDREGLVFLPYSY